MIRGRCAGCGETGPNKVIRSHTVRCAKFAALVKSDAGAALEPAREYQRWLDSGQADAEKADARQAQVDRTDDAREAMAERFKTRDPLEG